MKLAELLDHVQLDVLDHLDRQVTVPVVDGLQAQGDLIIIPLVILPRVAVNAWSSWREVPPGGVELIRGVAGNNPHTLVADPWTCSWSTEPTDPLGLGIAMLRNSGIAYLIHPEHGATGIAPGQWLVRRQQEVGRRGQRRVLVAD